MMKPDRVLVLGGTGSVGRLVVQALLNHDISARLLSRDPRKAKRMFATTDTGSNTIDIAGGDLMNPATIADALDHVNAVILMAHPIILANTKASTMGPSPRSWRRWAKRPFPSSS